MSRTAEIAKTEITKLLQMSDAQLIELPAMSEEVKVDGTQGRLTWIVWHDEVEGKGHRVIVAVYDKLIGTQLLEGFFLESSGTRRMVAEGETLDF